MIIALYFTSQFYSATKTYVETEKKVSRLEMH